MDALSLFTCLCFGLVVVIEGRGSPRAIRLVGPIAYIGQVQIFHENKWVSVCHDNWTLKNGHVVCRQLGYTRAAAVNSLNYAQLDGDQGDTIQGFNCGGKETRLDMCPLLAGNWTARECDKGTAGVICQTPRGTTYPVRLVGGRSDNEGRVEIKHGGEWGTVCDRGWDKPDADIICHQLGYGRAVQATAGASYGQGTGTILLSNVKCKEDDLRFRFDVRYCNVTDWYPSLEECTHANDAGVECDTEDPSLEIRLTGPEKDTIQIKYNEDWMSICDDNWNMKDARVVCRQLGYESAQTAPPTGFHGWQGYYLRNFLCTGNETRLDKCKKRGDWTLSRCANKQFAGVRCAGSQTIYIHHTEDGGGNHVKHHKVSAVESVIVVAVVSGILLFLFSGYFLGHKARQRRKRKDLALQLDETETATISIEENEMEEIVEPPDEGVAVENHCVDVRDDIPLVKEDKGE